MLYPLPYAYSTGLAIYRLKFLHISTLEGTLHGWVKDFTTHNLCCDLFFKLLGNTNTLMYTMILQLYAKIVLIMSYAMFEFKWSKFNAKQNT